MSDSSKLEHVFIIPIRQLCIGKLRITALPRPQYPTDQNGLDEKQLRGATKKMYKTNFIDEFVTSE